MYVKGKCLETINFKIVNINKEKYIKCKEVMHCRPSEPSI